MNDSIACTYTSSSRQSQSRQLPRRSAGALIRKRERDKENQKKKREREREHIAGLEAKVLSLEQELAKAEAQCHGYAKSMQSPPTDHALANGDNCSVSSEGEERIVRPCTTANGVFGASAQLSSDNLQEDIGAMPPPNNHSLPSTIFSPFTARFTSICDPPRSLPESAVVSLELLNRVIKSPEWDRVPAWNLSQSSGSYRFFNRAAPFAPLLAQLRADPVMKLACPPIAKTMDLLFGGSSNPLANFVHSEIVDLPCLPPEKFGIIYLAYLYLRWLVWPSQESFCSFPETFRPTILQLVQHHHLTFDLLPWPQLRDNFIRHSRQHDLECVVGLFCCSLRIKNWRGMSFVYRKNDEDPQVSDDFLQKIQDVSQWTLLETFWNEYPDLVQGLHPEIMLRQDVLVSIANTNVT
ncbi:hypothetical protein C7974DRAFT_92379 [Boeremia exigua]|uniref:uncharacterized protein n=1 Tax=Boeremia exigua TaxID=749465 RepID=UPI001E8E7EEF|nr:uncharacterized protein C7974DRAFT_92379 [Boeremia exigua]KAH6612172.1 hypothetical protein C7974DRAFT_92379 [Boeremia exigua]